MNNIFKVIWNHATQTWTAVGELASAKGKSKSVKLAAISTALLVVASSAQAEKKLLQTAENDAGLSVSVVNTDATTGSAKAYAYDGIAIGNNSVAGQEPKLKFDKDGKPVMKGDGTQDRENAGNAHIAIGLNAQAGNNGSSSPAVALGANSKSTDQGTVAVGNASSATSADTVAIGNSSVADSNGAVAVGAKSSAWFHGSALGEEAKARGIRSTALGNRAQATSDSAISIGFKTKVEGQFAIGIGRETSVTGKESVAVGNKSTISSANVSTLGANITVEAGRDGGVVLGHSSDAGKDTTKVVAVNNATVGTLTYSDFKGNLSKSTELQGRFVSVGKEGGERQIKHVAAGQITKDSTDAINGSQLYSVANTLGTAAKGLADTLGVTLGSDGTVSSFSQPLNIAKGSSYNNKDKDGKTITAPNVTTALTNLNNYVNAGWNVTASGNGYKNNVSIGHTVNFVGLGNVDVDGVDEENGVRTINISTDSPIDYASTTFDGKPVTKASDGKWYQVDENGDIKGDPIDASKIDKKGAKLTDSYTENNPYETAKPESKDEITAGKNGVQLNNVGWATEPDQAVNKDQLDQTVNKSGFFVKNDGNDVATKDSTGKEVSPKDKVTPNDVVNFKGDGIAKVNVETVRDDKGIDTTTITVGVDTSKLDLSNAVEFNAAENSGITVNTVKDGNKKTVTVGNKFFKTNADTDAEEAKVEADAPKGSVAIGPGAKAGKVNTGGYSIDSSANVAGKPNADTRVVSFGSPGKEAQLQNVAAGVVSETSTDAVNGSQLHATNVQVSKNSQNINRVESKVDSLSRVINNHASEFNRLDRKINKQGKEARAGIAGANAAAALPQAYTAGKAMVAAAAGTFKGQNALAVGYSRISDNGKVIFKLQGNANTSGDVGAGVGVGYQW